MMTLVIDSLTMVKSVLTMPPSDTKLDSYDKILNNYSYEMC